MGRFVALLAGVNVAGAGKAPMAELREAALAAGLRNPQTLLASGNLVFDSGEADAALESKLEAVLRERFGFAREVMVRSAAEWRAAIDANPMPQEAAHDPGRFLLIALERKAAADAAERLAEVVVAPERIEVRGREAYAWYPQGQGKALTKPKPVDRAIGCRGTGRNWNTVLKLAAMLEA